MAESAPLRDDHTHTIYSGHSPADSLVSDMVRAGADAGLQHLVVLEHLPVLPRGIQMKTWRKARNDRTHLNYIAEEIAWARAQHPDIQVLRGVELDADPWSLDGALMLDDLRGLDVLVVATHLFPGGEAFWFEPVRVVDPEMRRTLTGRWFDWVEKIVEVARPDAMAHPGCMMAARGWIERFDEPDVLARFARLGEKMAEAGTAFEINEGLGAKLAPAYLESYGAVLEAVRRSGARFTVCTDSHSCRTVGRYDRVPRWMDEAGITPDLFADLAPGKRGEPPPAPAR